jgi:subtilisin family serine protease
LAAIAAMAAVAFAGMPVASGRAAALPTARDEEWWFASWGIEKMAWPHSTGEGVTVAVLGNGVNAGVSTLRGAVVPGADVTRANAGDGRTDEDGSGTALAALIAGQGGSARMAGVAPKAKIMPVVIDGNSLPKAIRYAADQGAQVIDVTQSLPVVGEPLCEPDLQQAIAYAVDKNAVVIGAAGDYGDRRNEPESPGVCGGVLAVGAIDGKKQAWPRTARQPYVAVASPGWGVTSIDKDGRFGNDVTGTEAAAALTAGAVALVRAKYPTMSAREVVRRLINTAVDAGPPGTDDQTGAGAVLPPEALLRTVSQNAPNPPFDRLDRWLADPGRISSHPAAPTVSPEPKHERRLGLIFLLPLVLLSILAVVAIVLVTVVNHRRRPRTPPTR